MRISDWSSDVCSSDLLADALSGWPVRHPLGDPRNPPVTSLLTPLLGHWGMVLGAAPLGERAAQGFDVASRRLRLFSAGRFETPQIGRASCRARVCPYVEISVVAVALKKQHYSTIQSTHHSN